MTTSNSRREALPVNKGILGRALSVFHSASRCAKTILGACLLMIVMAGTVFAQNTGKISGTVVDPQTNEALTGVNIIIVGTSLGASTDIDGAYFILNVPPGKYNVQASMIGYEKIVQEDVIVNSSKTTTVNFQLKVMAVQTAAVVIEATRPQVEKDKTSTSMITRTDEIRDVPAMHNVNDILVLSSDVSDGHFRGGRSGEVLYTLQGMGIVNPLDNSNTMDPIMSAVEEVEVVTSGMGAQYGNTQSGIVNISMKEGKSDKWHSFTELRMSVPAKKHFGASPWDVSANPYLSYLMNFNNWTRSSLIQSSGKDITSNADGPNNHVLLAKDSVAMQQFSYDLYRQLNNNVNRSYGNKPDYAAEISTGGPISDAVRMFIAFNTRVSWPVLATEQPDESNQAMGNIVTDIGGGKMLRFSGAYSQTNTNLIPSNDNSYLGFLYNMLTGTTYQRNTNYQAGFRFTGALSQRSFLEVKLNGLLTRKQVGSRNTVTDDLVNRINTNSYWLAKQSPSLAGYQPSIASTFQDDRTQTGSLDASLTSQVTKTHLISAGMQSNMYFIDVNENSGKSITNGVQSSTKYYAKPVEGSMYVQDKMEFEGMIATVGLRIDGWSMRSTFGSLFDSLYTRSQDTKITGRLQPRAGFSFPVGELSVFHVNYGAYIQRPSFQYLVRDQQIATSGNYVPNPDLKPQSTNSYDLGLTQGLGEDLTLDVSGYYKNVNDLVKQVKITTNGYTKSQSIFSYINYDYADIRGFRVSLVKRKGNLLGSINYTYGVNTGSSSSPSTFQINYTLTKAGTGYTLFAPNNVPTQDVLLDYDRTHNLVVNLAYNTEHTFGFKIGNTYPLGDVSFALSSTATSGRPFTYSTGGSNEWMNMRTPAEYNTDMKLSKRFVDFYGTALTVYVEVYNVFDNKILNYNYITSAQPITEKYLAGNYSALASSVPASGLIYFDPDAATQGNIISKGYDQSFVVYSNQPRSYWFGVNVEF